MTVNATVTVAQAASVLVVPNAAVHTTNGTSTVTVYSGGQQVSTEVDPGLVGDTLTEIKGGLNEGDQVVLPTVRLSTSQRGNTFGGGGIRVGGGIRGGG